MRLLLSLMLVICATFAYADDPDISDGMKLLLHVHMSDSVSLSCRIVLEVAEVCHGLDGPVMTVKFS